jgi:hypothetical protein
MRPTADCGTGKHSPFAHAKNRVLYASTRPALGQMQRAHLARAGLDAAAVLATITLVTGIVLLG